MTINCNPPRNMWLQTEKTGLLKFVFQNRKVSCIIQDRISVYKHMHVFFKFYYKTSKTAARSFQ